MRSVKPEKLEGIAILDLCQKTLAFRSIFIPIVSIIINLLSVGTIYGLIVLVFQEGAGHTLLGLVRVVVIEEYLPLFLFAMLFVLQMEYQMFLPSQRWEYKRQNWDNTELVTFGLNSTGRLITGFTLIIVAVLGEFAKGDLVMTRQMGIALGVAVLVEAAMITKVLVPGKKKLLGRHNWYLPQWLA